MTKNACAVLLIRWILIWCLLLAPASCHRASSTTSAIEQGAPSSSSSSSLSLNRWQRLWQRRESLREHARRSRTQPVIPPSQQQQQQQQPFSTTARSQSTNDESIQDASSTNPNAPSIRGLSLPSPPQTWQTLWRKRFFPLDFETNSRSQDLAGPDDTHDDTSHAGNVTTIPGASTNSSDQHSTTTNSNDNEASSQVVPISHVDTPTETKLNNDNDEENDEQEDNSSLLPPSPLAIWQPHFSASGLAPSTTATLGSTWRWIRHHPQFAKWAVKGLEVGLALYLVQAVWKAASEIMDEFQAEIGRDSSPAFLQREMVSQILQELDPAVNTTPKVLSHQPMLAHLTQTLLASGMPLRSNPSDEHYPQQQQQQQQHRSMERFLLSLTRAEASLLQQCLWTPDEKSKDGWNQICGLQQVKDALLDLVWTWRHRDTSLSMPILSNPYANLVQNPPGVLLYGPPGCGKTLLVKAIAGEARLPCLVVTPSLLLRKYVGETNLQVRTLFQLAQKLSPCILCIDELDGLFRERSSTEHDVSRDLKTEFLQWWDGIQTSSHPILVVGATNRPFEVDSAVLRRMPQSHFVGLPPYDARKQVLEHLLKDMPLASDFSIHPLATETEGYTPSDLQQVLRTAVTMGPLREARYSLQYRPLTTNDILQAKALVAPTPLTASYRSALVEYVERNHHHQSNHNNNNHHQNSPWDSFFNAGTIHAGLEPQLQQQQQQIQQEWTEEDDGESYDEQESESDESE